MSKYHVSHAGFYYFSVVSLAIVLVLCGIFFGALLFSDYYAKRLKEDITLIAEFDRDVTPEQGRSIAESVADYQGIRKGSVRFVSKEEALAEIAGQLGSGQLEGKQENPFRHMLEFSLQADHVQRDSIARLSERVRAEFPVENVLYPGDVLNDLFGVLGQVRTYMFIVVLIGIILAGILIHHIIRLNVVAQQKQIRTMELVGASDGFIMRPFLRLGWNMSLSAWLLAVGVTIVLWFALLGFRTALGWTFSIAGLSVAGFLFLLSVFICLLSTFLAVRQSMGATYEQYA